MDLQLCRLADDAGVRRQGRCPLQAQRAPVYALLVSHQGQGKSALQFQARLQDIFCRGHHRCTAGLHIRRTPSPDTAVPEHSVKGRVIPAVLGRDSVDMAVENNPQLIPVSGKGGQVGTAWSEFVHRRLHTQSPQDIPAPADAVQLPSRRIFAVAPHQLSGPLHRIPAAGLQQAAVGFIPHPSRLISVRPGDAAQSGVPPRNRRWNTCRRCGHDRLRCLRRRRAAWCPRNCSPR